jgi:hypothetical protein
MSQRNKRVSLFAIPAATLFLFVAGLSAYQLDEPSKWYFLPSFNNYAPSGLPDFDQRQDEDWKNNYLGTPHWSHCGPVAAANLLWWFDSKHSNQQGFPGDGVDEYPLIRRVYGGGVYLDDHIPSIVHPFVELIADYTQTDEAWPGGTRVWHMRSGLQNLIDDAGTGDEYTVELITKPSFSEILQWVTNGRGVLLHLFGYYSSECDHMDVPGGLVLGADGAYARCAEFDDDGLGSGSFWIHWVAVAGVNPEGFIALSDPIRDEANPDSSGPDYSFHNDAAIVSHDVWPVEQGLLGYFYLDGYWGDGRITHAVVISDSP